jgi:hypothetical protein
MIIKIDKSTLSDINFINQICTEYSYGVCEIEILISDIEDLSDEVLFKMGKYLVDILVVCAGLYERKSSRKKKPASDIITTAQNVKSIWNVTPAILTKDDTIRILHKGFRIYVENENADQRFILLAVDDHVKNKIIKLKEVSRLRFISCAGISGIKTQIKNHCTIFPGDRFNALAVFDRDSDDIAACSEAVRLTIEECERHGVNYHVLKCRSIENYLTKDAALVAQPDWENDDKQLHKLSTFDNLTDEQKCVYHMKEGIDKKTPPCFMGLHQSILTTLKYGFTNQIEPSTYGKVFNDALEPIDGIFEQFRDELSKNKLFRDEKTAMKSKFKTLLGV